MATLTIMGLFYFVFSTSLILHDNNFKLTCVLCSESGLLKGVAKEEGREGVKWELGFALFWAGKMGFTALGLGFNHWEWDEQIRKWERDFHFQCSLTLFFDTTQA